jgi:16S rRNA (cytosine1402-N4)-methyltransferase
MMATQHIPVMLKECLAALDPKVGEVMVDGTLGLGGHAAHLVEAVGPAGAVIGFDWDLDMMAIAKKSLPSIGLVHADYRAIPEALQVLSGSDRFVVDIQNPVKISEPFVDGILLDMGLNSAQIEDPSRGISFMENGPLDMRMDRSEGMTAAEYLNSASEDHLDKVLKEFGEEAWSRKIAKVIVDRRKDKELATTQDLIDCVLAAIPLSKREKRIHPATRTFQAIRIEVNQELADLEEHFIRIANCLRPGGRMAVLSYHSLEDRPLKKAVKSLEATGKFISLNKGGETPSQEEIERNRRSRSARLRGVTKVKEEQS